MEEFEDKETEEYKLYKAMSEELNTACCGIFQKHIVEEKPGYCDGWQLECAMKSIGAVLNIHLNKFAELDPEYSLEVRENIVGALIMAGVATKMETEIAEKEAVHATKN